MKEKAKFYYALFSESGFDEKIKAEAERLEELYLYDLKEIVNLKNKKNILILRFYCRCTMACPLYTGVFLSME